MRTILNTVLFSLLLLTVTSGQAYAYLDPGTGHMMLQIIIGAVAGGLMTMKLYWARLRSFFSKPEDRRSTSEGSGQDSSV